MPIIDEYVQDGRLWHVKATTTFSSAMFLFQSGNPLHWFSASLLGHHALEMFLKSALIEAGCVIAKGDLKDGYVWGHNLLSLAQALKSRRPSFPFSSVECALKTFGGYFEELRYPTKMKKVEGLGELEMEQLSQSKLQIEIFATPLTSSGSPPG